MVKREDCELIKYFDWLSWQEKIDPRLAAIYHVPNERKCSMYAGKIMKQKGVRAGVPDVCGPIPTLKYPGFYFELKIKPNTPSPKQIAFCKLLCGLGYCVHIAWSGNELIELTKKYLKGEI